MGFVFAVPRGFFGIASLFIRGVSGSSLPLENKWAPVAHIAM
jgi:hypothetical protein